MRPSGAVRKSFPICPRTWSMRAGELRPDARLDALLREVEARFEMAEEIDEFGADRLKREAEFPSFIARALARARSVGA